MNTRHRTLAAVLALLATAALLTPPAAAQEQEEEQAEQADRPAMMRDAHHGAKGPMRGHGMAGMRAMHAGGGMHGGHGAMLGHVPTAILHQHEMLGLSEQQLSRLEALRDSVEAIRERGRSGMMEAHQGLEGAFGEGGIDVQAYRQAVRAAADRMVEHRVAVAAAAQDALQVLDEGQREKFLYGVHLMQRMRSHHGRGHGMRGARGDRQRWEERETETESEEHEHEGGV